MQKKRKQCSFKYLIVTGKALEHSGYLTGRKCTCEPCDFCCSLGHGGLEEWMKNCHKTGFLPKVANPIRFRAKSTAKTVVPSVIREGIIAEIADPPPVFSPGIPPRIFPSGCWTTWLKQSFLFLRSERRRHRCLI